MEALMLRAGPTGEIVGRRDHPFDSLTLLGPLAIKVLVLMPLTVGNAVAGASGGSDVVVLGAAVVESTASAAMSETILTGLDSCESAVSAFGDVDADEDEDEDADADADD